MTKSRAPVPTPGGWGDRIQFESEEAMNREELLALANKIAAALRAAAPAPSEINHFEDTPAGRIDWKMEAERANRLLATSERAAPARCEPVAWRWQKPYGSIGEWLITKEKPSHAFRMLEALYVAPAPAAKPAQCACMRGGYTIGSCAVCDDTAARDAALTSVEGKSP